MSESIRAVERALDVLLCFTSQTPELTMTQISEMVGINKSTVQRLLATLESKRFVEREPSTGVYRLGIRLVQMAFFTLERNDLRRMAAPYLHDLCDRYQENVNLSVMDEVDVVYVDVIESTQRLKLAATTGEHLPAYCTASGKAMLAFLPEADVWRILDRGMHAHTRNTITSQDAFFRNMRETRERGFAISEQEFEEGINAIAAPILSSAGVPVASISIAGPAYRLTRDRMDRIGSDLMAAAKKIAREVGLAENLG